MGRIDSYYQDGVTRKGKSEEEKKRAIDLEKKLEKVYNFDGNITEGHKLTSLYKLKGIYETYLEKDDEEIVGFLFSYENVINYNYSVIEGNVSPSTTSEIPQDMWGYYGGKRKSKSKKNNVSKKPVVSQKKQSEYKEILGKKMKIYKMPDSRKQYVRYKGELHSISDYKNLMKQKAAAKAKK
jgi:hypothetical protein